MLTEKLRRLTPYLMAGALALGGVGCKKEYEVKKVGEDGRSSIDNLLGEEERGEIICEGSIIEQIKKNEIKPGETVYADVHENPGYEKIVSERKDLGVEVFVYSYSNDLLGKKEVGDMGTVVSLVNVVGDEQLEFFVRYAAGTRWYNHVSLYKFYKSDFKEICKNEGVQGEAWTISDLVKFIKEDSGNYKVIFFDHDHPISRKTIYKYNETMKRFLRVGTERAD